jgi:adenylate cyclase
MRPSLLILLAAMMVAVAIGLGGQSGMRPVTWLNQRVLDTLLVKTASGAPAPGTVVVDIDEVSLAAAGQWPWPRYRIAELIRRVAAAGPSAIALDIVFPEADRVSLDDIRKTYKRDFGIDMSFNGVPDGLLDNDGYLGSVMARFDVVGARYFYFDHATRDSGPVRSGVGIEGRTDLLTLDSAHGVLVSVDAIDAQTRVSGFINSRVDADGRLRRLPLLLQYDGVVHASLALAATMRGLGVNAARVTSDSDGLVLHVGSHRVPIDRMGYATLRFNGPSPRYDGVSAVDVLNGRVRPADLHGRIVFIGSSAKGLHDTEATVLDPDFSGLKIQSVLAQNILDGTAVRMPAWGDAAALVLTMLLAMLFAALFCAGIRLLSMSAVSMACAGALLATCAAVFAGRGMFLPLGVPLLALAALLVLAFMTRFLLGQRQAQRWRKALENARQVTIESMAAVAETRDPETGAHIKRTQHYVRAIAEQLQRAGHHGETLDREYIDLLFQSAPLHDIGKVGVPDHILLKPGPLTPAEMEIMRRHAEYGREIILSAADQIDGENFLRIAADIAGTHHEKWDGTGYPDGLSGQDIPLAGRIMAVADIYDALISRRCYKEPFPHQVAIGMMRELRGTTFDPVVLDAFLAIEAEILHIAACFRDEEENEAHAQPADAATHARPGWLTAVLQMAVRVRRRVLSPPRPRGP